MTALDGARPAETEPTGLGRDEPPSSVAREAALLADLLAQRGSFVSRTARRATEARSAGSSPQREQRAAEPPEGATDAPADGGELPHAEPQGAPTDRPAGSSPHECTCGGQVPSACRVCPVCQVIAFVQKVNPETIDRVADFAAFAAAALRDLADARREETAAAPSASTPPSTPPAASSAQSSQTAAASPAAPEPAAPEPASSTPTAATPAAPTAGTDDPGQSRR